MRISSFTPAAAVSIVLTLVLQTVAVQFLGTTARLTNTAVTYMDQSDMSGATVMRGVSQPFRGLGAGVRRNPRLTGILAVLAVIAVLLLVIGAGYAFTALDLPFLGHLAAFAAGVGLVEELSKAAAGLAILYMILCGGSGLSRQQFERRILAALGIAGLGFGAGEALFYFGACAAADSGMLIYAIRAVWCITLHGAWALITGHLLAQHLPLDSAELEADGGRISGRLLISCLPSLLLHAVYNSCCLHGSGFCWMTGAVSLLAAAVIIDGRCSTPEPATADG